MTSPSKDGFFALLAPRITAWSKAYILRLKLLSVELVRVISVVLKKIQQAILWLKDLLWKIYYQFEGALLGGVVNLWFFAISLKVIVALFAGAAVLYYFQLWILLAIYVIFLVGAAFNSFKTDQKSFEIESESHRRLRVDWVGKLRWPLRGLTTFAMLYLWFPFAWLPPTLDFLTSRTAEQTTPITRQVGETHTPVPPKYESTSEQNKIHPLADIVAPSTVCGKCAAKLQFDSVSLKNDCNMNIRVAIYYNKNTADVWVTQGWWDVPKGKTIKTNIRSDGEKIFFYAKSSDGKEWDGSDDPKALELQISDRNFSYKEGEAINGNNVSLVKFYSRDTGKYYRENFEDFQCD